MTESQQPTEEWVEGEEFEGEGDEESEDADAEAEEIARRLGDQLWADINKAQADRAASAAALSSAPPQTVPPSADAQSDTTLRIASKREEAAIATMKNILSHAQKDPLVLQVFSSTVVPNTNGKSALDVFNQTVESGTITKELAKPLSRLVVSLARSKPLFATLRHSDAASIQLKRKREEATEAWRQDDLHSSKRPFYPQWNLRTQVTEAVHIVTQALGPTSNRPIDSSLISSIQLQLHQIFLFAVTASAGGGPEMNALQEISGLIQVVGVLSGIQIGSTLGTDPKSSVPQQPSTSSPALQTTDIGTAVYPCLVPGCRKIFSRLYSLRAHQRGHATHRPYRCTTCPASFARNHDLKRHTKLHDKKAWKCCGCDKIFSRRDAIKRHKNSNKIRGVKGDACVTAELIEVDLDHGEGDEVIKEGRRAKIWSGIVGNQGGGTSGATGYSGEERYLDEGEVDPGVIVQVQTAVTSLHGLLQAHVANLLGIPSAEQPASDVDPTAGQATLASVIARAQLQNLQLNAPQPSQELGWPTAAVAWGMTVDPKQVPSELSLTKERTNQGLEVATPSLSRYGLSEEQTKMLEQAIANAASAAHAQAEAEAALEEEEEKGYEDDDDEAYDENEGNEGSEVVGVS